MTDCPVCNMRRVLRVKQRAKCLHCGAFVPVSCVSVTIPAEIGRLKTRWLGALLRVLTRLVPGCTYEGHWPGTMEFYPPEAGTAD